jgi:abequosyltransferase
MTPVRLSICIPTYNFGPYIGATLETVLSQVVDGVEVVVLDGGSTDDTPQVVASLQDRFPSLRYHRLDERGGIDRDMARTVALARGEYCWIFCADDLMKPGAIEHVLSRLGSGCDVYLCGLTLCTFDMQPLRDHPVAGLDDDEEFDLQSPADRLRYFEHAQTTTAFFSFAGSLIIRRQKWDAAGPDERFMGSLWAHVARILRMIPHGLRLHYIPASLLHKRTQNDSFMDAGIITRYEKAIDGYHRLAATYFPPDSAEARHIRRVVTNEFTPLVLLALKLESRRNGTGEEAAIDRLAATTYRDVTPRNLLYRAIYRGTPLSAFAAAQAFNRRLVLPRRQPQLRPASTPPRNA